MTNIPEIPKADFYVCTDDDEETHTNPVEAIEEWLDGLASPDCDMVALIKEHPVELIPRDYQQAAADSVFAYWERGGPGSPLIEMPTGSGKSLVLALIAIRLVQEFESRVFVVTDRKELIQQDAKAIRSLWPDAPVGVFSAGLNSKRIDVITVGGVQSMLPYAKKHDLVAPSVVLIDEAQMLSPDETTQYGQLLAILRGSNPDLRLVGLTATPYRMGQGLLTAGEDALFSCITYKTDIISLIDRGFLSPLVSPKTSVTVDTSKAATQAGEWVLRDLELAADLDAVNAAVASDIFNALHPSDLTTRPRTSALVFGVAIAHVNHLCEAIRATGVNAVIVTGETPNRESLLDAFKKRELPCIVSCDILTTGFDAPCTDVIALVRPTKSPGLYVQMGGRGMRVCEGKSDCLLLDYGGNIARHGPITNVREPAPRRAEKGEPIFKICPQCKAECAGGCRTCVHCDYEFPPPEEKKANDRASNLDPMARAVETTYDVASVSCGVHTGKSSGSTTFRVTFFDEAWQPIASEYVCLEHEGYARDKAHRWWKSFFTCPPPSTCEEAVTLQKSGYMRTVKTLTVLPDGKWKRIKGATFEDREPGHDEATQAPTNEIQEDDIPF